MKAMDFDNAFRPFTSRLLSLGFAEKKSSQFTKIFESPAGCILEFGGDRYYEELSVSMSGPFSGGEYLVFPFLADVLDAALAHRIRAHSTFQGKLSEVIDFLEQYLTRIVCEPQTYMHAYKTELSRHGFA